MSRDCGNVPRSRKHLSASNPLTKQTRKTFWRVSESSSLSSHRNSPAQSDDDWSFSNQAVKNVTEEEKDGMLKKLQCQVKELRHKLRILEDRVENKDYAIGTVTREKDRVLGEMRRLERSNKQLKQQLNDERDHYLEEKEKFCEEMTKYKKKLQEIKTVGDSRYLRGPIPVGSKISAGTWQKGDSAEVTPGIGTSGNVLSNGSEFRKSTSVDSVTLYQGQDLSLQMAALRTENAKLKAIIIDREERNYELCLRFLRMKHSKNDLRNRFQDLEQEYLQVITNLMEKIDEARDEFNFIIDQKFKKPLHSNNAKYLRMVQKNSKIAHENITLRMELQSLRKQLSRGNIGQGDFGSGRVEAPKKSSSDSKPKSTRKVAGVRQMKSDGNLMPKASDTDSNYMSKTSTTDPSTASTGGGKSSESIFNESANTKSKKIHNNLFSDDILQKIFELVDTQSSSNIRDGTEKGNLSLQKLESKHGKASEHKDLSYIPLEGTGKRYVECTQNAKRFHEIIVQGTTMKKITPSKEKTESPLLEARIEKKKSNEITKPRRKLSDFSVPSKNKSQFNALKERTRPFVYSDRADESRKENFRLRGSSSWHRVKDEKDGVYEFGKPRQYRSRKQRRLGSLISDSCGLEEKLDSDGDMSPDNDIETPIVTPKSGRLIDHYVMVKHKVPHEVRGKVWNETQTGEEKDRNSDDSAIGSSKIRNRNSISLHDELMEATKSQSQTDDPFWRRELNLHSLITKKSASSSKTYCLTGRKSRFLSEGHNTPDVMDEDEGDNVKEVDIGVGTMDMEERSRSQKEMSPKFTHKTTSANDLVMTESELVLQFLMPPATILSAQSFVYDENSKESPLRLGKEQGSPPHSVGELGIPTSNVPSSCTTVDLAESSPARENGLRSRTLSAPALIESDWFNNFKMWEMKDCSTNT